MKKDDDEDEGYPFPLVVRFSLFLSPLLLSYSPHPRDLLILAFPR